MRQRLQWCKLQKNDNTTEASRDKREVSRDKRKYPDKNISISK